MSTATSEQKPRGGRPKKQPHEKRGPTIRARVTLAEQAYVQEQAALAGVTPTEYIRRRVLGFSVSPSPRQEDASILTELNRIGVNVNQIARNLNSGRPLNIDIDLVQAKLLEAIEKVSRAYGP